MDPLNHAHVIEASSFGPFGISRTPEYRFLSLGNLSGPIAPHGPHAILVPFQINAETVYSVALPTSHV